MCSNIYFNIAFNSWNNIQRSVIINIASYSSLISQKQMIKENLIKFHFDFLKLSLHRIINNEAENYTERFLRF